MAKKVTPEQIVKKSIMQYLATLPNCEVFPIATTGMWDVTRRTYRKSTMRPGTPDILCCLSGRFVAIEVKAPRGSVSEDQKQVIEAIVSRGKGVAFVARSIQDVIDNLRGMGEVLRLIEA